MSFIFSYKIRVSKVAEIKGDYEIKQKHVGIASRNILKKKNFVSHILVSSFWNQSFSLSSYSIILYCHMKLNIYLPDDFKFYYIDKDIFWSLFSLPDWWLRHHKSVSRYCLLFCIVVSIQSLWAYTLVAPLWPWGLPAADVAAMIPPRVRTPVSKSSYVSGPIKDVNLSWNTLQLPYHSTILISYLRYLQDPRTPRLLDTTVGYD